MVVLGARRIEKLRATQRSIEDAGGRAEIVQCDVSIPEDCHRLVSAALPHQLRCRHQVPVAVLVGRRAWLRPGGRIYLEIAFDQAELALEIAGRHAQFEDVRVLKDHAGNNRVLTARRGSSA